MGTPDFAVPALETLVNSRHTVSCVVTQPDRPRGRKGTPAFSPVKECALRHGIPVFQPEKIRHEENIPEIRKYHPDAIVVAAFGQILSKEILDIPKYGCFNIHASLLPRWRGAAPIQWAIINGDKKTGITIMQMNEGLDTGDILAVKETEISDDETGGSLFDRLSEMGGPLMLEVLDQAEEGKLDPKPQGEPDTPYAKMLRKDMGEIDFSEKTEFILRKMRGLSPWPGSFTFIDGKRLSIFDAEKVTPDESESGLIQNAGAFSPGEVMRADGELIVKTGDLALRINELQLSGKKRMDTEDFLRGYRIQEGTRLGKK